MDFFADNLFNKLRIRALTIGDNSNQEYLPFEVGQRLSDEDMVAVMKRLTRPLWRVLQRLQTGNGSELISKSMGRWAYENQLTIDFSRTGKATDSSFIELFYGSLRDEYLNIHWLLYWKILRILEYSQKKIEQWQQEYNHFPLHASLNPLTPA